MSVCLYVIKPLSDLYSYTFCLILTKLGTCANVQKTMEQIFKILTLKFLPNLLLRDCYLVLVTCC